MTTGAGQGPIFFWTTAIWVIAILAAATLLSAALIVALRPLLRRYTLAQPNARSSHTVPTPQGGGAAVVAATLAVSAAALFWPRVIAADTVSLAILFSATVAIAVVGIMADRHALTAGPRLLLQGMAVAAAIVALPEGLRVVPFLPWWLERALLVFGGLWFVNLVNFMDGLDWMTVAETVPVTAALTIVGLLGLLPPAAIAISTALCGAMLGFASFNRPVARLFLGDVGSLPIGLLMGWLLVQIAGRGGHAAAILLPLYYLADSTVTLLRRAWNGEPVWVAHRSHFYQRATDNGFRVIDVVTLVFLVNLALAALALATLILPAPATDAAALTAGGLLVAGLLFAFAHRRHGLKRKNGSRRRR
jgi:UDP-N-acetylmuramyl pentapeptide phosphotransferase/UDP-N-acetylglucosamine-1-phosphate transferase